jgi:hypothetical protein
MSDVEWKPVEGFSNYIVSNMGDIINVERGVLIEPLMNSSGYLRYCLYKNGKKKQMFVHRLIAKAFLPAVEGADYVDHINRDKLDNRSDNLRWVTMSQNNLNSTIRKDKKNTKSKNVFKCFNSYRWSVIINGIKTSSKCFKTEQEAANDLKEAAADGKLSIFLSLE